MRSTALALTSVFLSAVASAQGALFLRDGHLVPAGVGSGGVEAALTRLVRGPTQSERAQGWTTALPPGTELVGVRRRGRTTTAVFGGSFADRVANRAVLEQAIEQIVKTVLHSDPQTNRVDIEVTGRDGIIRPLSALFEFPTPPRTTSIRPPESSQPVLNGALTGRTIAVSPGHGYYWHSTLGWTTQRGDIGGLIEDIHTNEIAIRYLIPYLENMGARVLSCRERGEVLHEALGDNDQGIPIYQENGTWTTSSSAGYQNGTYRYAGTASLRSASASWTVPVPADGNYPVYVFYRGSSNRTTDARYEVHHSGGVTQVALDQTRNDRTWVHLGDFHFRSDQGARLILGNESAQLGKVVIADVVRVGAGVGSIVRGGGPSGQPRWKESSRYWTEFSGAPPSVWDSINGGEDNSDDVTARPRYAEWRGADCYISLHTNAGGGTGTSSFIHNTAPSAGSAALQLAVHNQLVTDIRASYDSNWVDRGTKSANFGEVRLLSTMPGVLVELAFHDTVGSKDHDALHDPHFRRIGAAAYATGVLRYFSPSAPAPPTPPPGLRVTQDGARGLQVAWQPVTAATFYSVEVSDDGRGFIEIAQIPGTTWSTGPLPHHTTKSFRVRAWNSTGRSEPTEVLTAGTDHRGTASLLIVQGFDRFDRFVKGPENTLDYTRLHGDGIRRNALFSLGFDAATNEAVQNGHVTLGDYRAVDWLLGEESTRDETFNSSEQALIRAYLAAGGGLLVTGAEIGWDLDAQGSATDRAFYRDVLGARHVADDAGTYIFAPHAGGIFAGIPTGAFDDGSHGTFDVDWPDVLAPSDGRSTTSLLYDGLVQAAGLQRIDGPARVVHLGFPLEAIVDPDLRADVMQRSLRFLLNPMELESAETVRLGETTYLTLNIPQDAGMGYILGTSRWITPPIPLPGGAIAPLRDSELLTLGWTPSPYATGFIGQLDGNGKATASLSVPSLASLVGWDLYFAGVTQQPTPGFVLRTLLPWTKLRITW